MSSASDSLQSITQDYISIGKDDMLSETFIRSKPLLCEYIQKDSLPNFTPYYSKPCPVKSAISSPIRYKGKIRAILVGDSKTSDYFNQERLELLWQFGNICSSILNIYLVRTEDIHALKFSEVAPDFFHRLFKNSSDFEKCLDAFISGIKAWLNFHTLTLAIRNSKSELVVHRSIYNDGATFLPIGRTIDTVNSAMGQSFVNNYVGAIDKISKLGFQPRFYLDEREPLSPDSSMLLIPFSIDESSPDSTPLGILCIEHEKSCFFKDEIFFKIRFFVESLAMSLQSIHQQSVIESSEDYIHELPKVLNMGLFQQLLEQEILRCNNENRQLGICIIGIDDIDKLVRSHGIEKVKEIIRRVEISICDEIKPYELIGLYGDGVFSVARFSISQDDFQYWLENMRLTLSKIVFQNDTLDRFTISVSIGAKIYQNNSGGTLKNIMSDAAHAFEQLKISRQITNRETHSLDTYLQEIGKFDLLTSQGEIDLTLKIKKGDGKSFGTKEYLEAQYALEKLIKSNLRFVVSVAKQYQNQGLSLGDLINEGNLGLIKAAKRFDETRGFKFISYAVWWIRQSILQALAEQSRIVRLPLNRVGTLNKITRAFSKLEQEFEREPNTEEIANLLDMEVEEVTNTLKISGRHVSVDAPFAQGEDNRLLDVLQNDSNRPDHSVTQDSLRIEIERSLSTLSERESDVVRSFYGIGLESPLTLEEIGEKFNLTRERVRQIKEKAIRRLRVSPHKHSLKEYIG
ncbi:hypothetical protein CHS0354_000446 [Potamilus streckersoni]|uniref:GGDEF domain-containing protein n=1 Tax=Potamilus streckersoni TaxID=2493646 RepID=A0AAE0T7C3_9BIVA|nr:hypothetical protein CHS0354_000446 [Potamilus streckersoni]